MKANLLFVFIFCSLFSYAGRQSEFKGLYVDYMVKSSVLDPNLKKDQSSFLFEFTIAGMGRPEGKIKFSANGKEYIANLGKGKEVCETSLTLKPGKYRFQFYYNEKHYEIYTDSIDAKPQHKTTMLVTFTNSEFPVICDKPVIYLYPEKATEVSVALDIHGEFVFTYPTYNNGWNVTANPDGTLSSNGKTYNYLFWEGKSNFSFTAADQQEGFIVESKNLVSFFEEKLSLLGLNSKEMADYITYWVPRMQQKKNHFVRFIVNDEYNQYATLTVSPQPDSYVRVFMIWDPLDENETPIVKEQKLSPLKREGFTLVEWGGTEVELPN